MPASSPHLYIEVDLPRLCTNMSREEDRMVPREEVLKWLRDAGFAVEGNGWVVSENDLGQLLPCEVTVVEDWPRLVSGNLLDGTGNLPTAKPKSHTACECMETGECDFHRSRLSMDSN